MSIKNRLLIFLLLATMGLSAQTSQVQLDYIKRYSNIAIREMERAGVPASIKLAQGLLESNSGRSDLARRANNHFGMKCGANWKGNTMYKEDDDYDENGQLIKSCFRSYRNADASFVAHSEFLLDPRKAFRYGFLFRLDPYDYKAWAKGLKRAGYATSPTYPEKLISLIERYQLDQYDKRTLAAVEDPTLIPEDPRRPSRTNTGRRVDLATGVLRANDVGYVLVNEGESLEDIALRVQVSVGNLLDYNESASVRTPPEAGDRIYVQPKRSAYHGRKSYHEVKPGETMMDISDEYAVKLDKLLARNRLTKGQEPAVGEKIKLRGWGKVKETPRLRGDVDNESTQPDNPFIPTTPSGELDMKDPDDDFGEEKSFEEPTPTRPPTTRPDPAPSNPPSPNQPEQPKVIINPGSQPVTTPPSSTTNPTPTPTRPNTQPAPPPVIQPTPTPTPTQPNAAVYHTVVAGETLWRISRRYNTTVDALKQLNGLTNNNISIGMQLRVK